MTFEIDRRHDLDDTEAESITSEESNPSDASEATVLSGKLMDRRSAKEGWVQPPRLQQLRQQNSYSSSSSQSPLASSAGTTLFSPTSSPLYSPLYSKKASYPEFPRSSSPRSYTGVLIDGHPASMPGQTVRAASPEKDPGIDTAYMWLAMYFFFNLVLTIYNKAVMQFLHFRYPWTLTGVHTLFSGLGCMVLAWMGVFTPAKLGMRENIVMVAFSVLYTVNIAISNVSLNLVTVPFHQVVRATTPVFMIVVNIMWLKKYPSRDTFLSLIPVVLGVAVATFGDYYYTRLGFGLTVFGTILAALKTVVTNQVQVGKLKLHPMDLLLRMSPLALLQTMFYAWYTGETERMSQEFSLTPFALCALIGNGALAFGLNVVSFTANRKTSALTMGVAANVKQVLSIVLAVVIFGLKVGLANGLGILITLLGGAWYSRIEYMEKTKKDKILPMDKKDLLVEPRLVDPRLIGMDMSDPRIVWIPVYEPRYEPRSEQVPVGKASVLLSSLNGRHKSPFEEQRSTPYITTGYHRE